MKVDSTPGAPEVNHSGGSFRTDSLRPRRFEGAEGEAGIEGGRPSRKRARDDNDNNGVDVHVRPRKRRRSKDSWWIIENCTWLFFCIEILLYFVDTPAAIAKDERDRLNEQEREEQFTEYSNHITAGGRRVYVADAGVNVIPHSGTGTILPDPEHEQQPETATPTWPPTSYPYTGDPISDSQSESSETPPGTEDAGMQSPPPSDSDGEDDHMPGSDEVSGGVFSFPPTKTQRGGHIVTLPGGITHVTGPFITQRPVPRTDDQGRFLDEQDRLIDGRGRLIDEDGQLIDEHGRIPHRVLRDDPPMTRPPQQNIIVNEEGQFVNSIGQLVNDNGQLVDEHGRIPAHLFEDEKPTPKTPPRVPQVPPSRPPQVPPTRPPQVSPQLPAPAPPRRNEQGRLVDGEGRMVNEQGHLVNEEGLLIDEQGRLVDRLGRLLDAFGRLVNAEGQIVDGDGFPIMEEAPADEHLPPDSGPSVFLGTTSAAAGPSIPPADPTSFLDSLPGQQQQPGGRLPPGFDDSEEGEDLTAPIRAIDRQYRLLPPNNYVIRGGSLGPYGLPLAPDMVVEDERPVPPLREKYMDRFTFPPRKCGILQYDEPCNETFTNGRALREHQLTHDYMMSGAAGPDGTIDLVTEEQVPLPEGEAERLLQERQIRRITYIKETALQRAAWESNRKAKEAKDAEERARKARERAEAPLTEEDFGPDEMTPEEFENSFSEEPPDSSEEGLTADQQSEVDESIEGQHPSREDFSEAKMDGVQQTDPFLEIYTDEELQAWAEEENDREYPDPYS
ncbi:hypothetical protein SLS60_002202 [Paraconiothyrium brasiliense]|uniref:C2H2-type domain-containing protein n=1 Tax=Paraconiothyrium brasiliense TaxID=300254 RepID=A0ABR3S213_9PLEO